MTFSPSGTSHRDRRLRERFGGSFVVRAHFGGVGKQWEGKRKGRGIRSQAEVTGNHHASRKPMHEPRLTAPTLRVQLPVMAIGSSKESVDRKRFCLGITLPPTTYSTLLPLPPHNLPTT